LKEKLRLTVCENRIVSRISAPERKEETLTKPHKENVHEL
jgi:hypothetical protein